MIEPPAGITWLYAELLFCFVLLAWVTASTQEDGLWARDVRMFLLIGMLLVMAVAQLLLHAAALGMGAR